jgi:hypothetical protein
MGISVSVLSAPFVTPERERQNLLSVVKWRKCIGIGLNGFLSSP